MRSLTLIHLRHKKRGAHGSSNCVLLSVSTLSNSERSCMLHHVFWWVCLSACNPSYLTSCWLRFDVTLGTCCVPKRHFRNSPIAPSSTSHIPWITVRSNADLYLCFFSSDVIWHAQSKPTDKNACKELVIFIFPSITSLTHLRDTVLCLNSPHYVIRLI